MKKHLLLLSALCLMSVGSVHAQSELVTDGSTPAVLAPPVRAKAPLQGLFKTCDPTVSDPTVIAGSWYAVDNSKLFLTADGKATASVNSSVTDFEYFPFRGDLVLLNAEGEVVKNYHVLRLTKDYLVFRLVGGSYAVYYPFDRFATSLTLSDSEFALLEGENHKLTVEHSPSGSIKPALIWSSSNTDVATVNAEGLVTAVSVGNCTITVETGDGSLSATCDVVVKGHTYVNLGLPSGTLWATCNIGATAPEESGDYFAWGETNTKSSYTWDNYKYCKGTYDTMTKYCVDEYSGKVDGLTLLSIDDDVAYKTWGEGWRMPRIEQYAELYNPDYTTVEAIQQNGKEGLLITSKQNGNSIFMPLVGYTDDNGRHDDGWGYYWSRTLYKNVTYCGLGLNISSGGAMYATDYYQYRYVGLTVRPVYEGTKSTLPTLNESNLTLRVGDTRQLIVSSPIYNVPSNSVDWSSSNDAVATVGPFGLVTAKQAGNCTITASAKGGGWSITCSVVVKDYEYVDLGLSSGTLWATCNVGATSPEDYGDYFAWGESKTKLDYTWDNYFDSENGSPVFFNKFYNGTRNDKLGLTELSNPYDAAYNNWGAGWNMPTAEQASELVAECTWTWNKEKNGYNVVGPNANSIFLPAAGYYDGTSCLECTKKGYFWTRSLTTPVYSAYADIIYFATNLREKGSATRDWGIPVRPIRLSISK